MNKQYFFYYAIIISAISSMETNISYAMDLVKFNWSFSDKNGVTHYFGSTQLNQDMIIPEDLKQLDLVTYNAINNDEVKTRLYNILQGIIQTSSAHNDNEQLNNYDAYGYTPLLRAIDNNNLEEVEKLINAGANVEMPHQMRCNMVPLLLAAQKNNMAIVNRLLQYDIVNLLVKHAPEITKNNSSSDHNDCFKEIRYAFNKQQRRPRK